MLEYLSSFCDFYVYSHGLKSYIMVILEQIDPDCKYFKNRDYTVLAPKPPYSEIPIGVSRSKLAPIDSKEQKIMMAKKKRFTDFRDPKDGSKALFSKDELNRTLILDDQFLAIHDKDRLIISKKFLRFASDCTYVKQ